MQIWLDQPALNFGWMLKAANESVSQTVRRIASRETGNNLPQLVVVYRLGPRLALVTATNGVFSFSFWAEANRAYTVESTAALPSPGPWQIASNIPPATVDREFHFSEALTGGNRLFRVVEE